MPTRNPPAPLPRNLSLVPIPVASTWDWVLAEAKNRVDRQSGERQYAKQISDSPDWGLGAVLSMLIWNDVHRIAEIQDGPNGFHEWRSVRHRQNFYGDGGRQAGQALRSIVHALKRGELDAIVDGKRQDRHAWFGLDERKDAAKIFFLDPRFERDQVVKLWERHVGNAEMSCRQWLEGKMRASLLERPMPKARYLSEAQEKFSDLSRKGFARAWTTAIGESQAHNWKRPGRKKSPR